jgi:CRISPR-associated protein Csb3
MTELRLRGDFRSALSHMTMIGLAAILEDAGIPDVRVSWTDELDSTPVDWTTGVDLAAAAAIVREHAERHSRSGSWVSERIDMPGRPEPTGLMSPRIKAPKDRDGWEQLARARAHAIDALTNPCHRLDLSFIGSLGAPSYWHSYGRDPRPDDGASRWEMKTRNRGEEFVGNRLSPLASCVAGRDATSIRQGLDGTITRDLPGKDLADSRTATGLAAPGPTDDAAAWCGLWAISQFPVIPLVSRPSRTAGHVRIGKGTRGWFYLPMPSRQMPMPRLRSIIVSGELELLVRAHLAKDQAVGQTLEVGAAREWLRRRGVGAVACFAIQASANPSAPELRALDAVVVPLGASGER